MPMLQRFGQASLFGALTTKLNVTGCVYILDVIKIAIAENKKRLFLNAMIMLFLNNSIMCKTLVYRWNFLEIDIKTKI